ncbi:MAG: TetR/AcrR family transcriptional regulator [Candidatus Sulfotelmatobacter sp.]
MSRTVNEKRPEELLEAIGQYLTKHGLIGLSLRPLAKAVGSSPRVLLYYFGSKEKMVVRVLAQVRQRQRAVYDQIQEASLGEACWTIWKHMSAPNSEPFFRVFFEAYSLALRRPQLYKDFLQATIEDWLEFAANSFRHEGYGQKEARAFATVVVAGLRGFMLDFCATRDRKRLDRAVSLWLRALDSIQLDGRKA